MIQNRTLGGRTATAISILFVVLMIPAACYLPPKIAYISIVLLMLLFMITIGLYICGRPAGILINERNLMSLSRLQLLMWTLIILSAFLVAVLGRIHAGQFTDALNIQLDQRLWALLGISTASLVGTPLLQAPKKVQEPKPEAVVKGARALRTDPVDVATNAQGVLFANPSINDAAFSDMFQGDEVSNAAYVDVAKLQMFFFTIVAGLTYGIELYKWLEATKHLEAMAKFPELSTGLIAILGISHAGFQVNNSVTRTPTQ